jgi:hypothetical protein
VNAPQSPGAARARRQVEQLLACAEPRIALIARCQPLDAAAERARLLACHARGEALVPCHRYAPPPQLAPLRSALRLAARALDEGDAVDNLYAARCRELALEAELAERVGRPDFAGLARRRFTLGGVDDSEHAARLAASWVRAAPNAAEEEPRFRSDDASEPRSLLSCLARRIGEHRLAFRIVVDARLSAVAATGAGVIHVKAGVALTQRDAERITTHELEAHALPRARALSEALGLLRVGSAGSVEDEEGRALVLEERGGWFDDGRRRTLGLRHECGLALAQGADWRECMLLLERLGCTPELALGVLERVGRGGGLCRELVYLPAWSRVTRELAAEPELERWLERGRLSLAAARILRSQ